MDTNINSEYLDLIVDPDNLADYNEDDLDKLLKFIQQLESSDTISSISLNLDEQQFICKPADSASLEEILMVGDTAYEIAESIGFDIDDVDFDHEEGQDDTTIYVAYIL